MNIYQTNHLEDYVEEIYHSIGINSPSQLNIIDIAARLNIWIYFSNFSSRAIDRDGLYSINIDRRLSKAKQWEEFGHEMAHLLRDAGNQLTLPSHIVNYQEVKANSFALEFCIPTFMLLSISLPIVRKDAIDTITEKFNVTPSFAEKKLVRFENKSIQSIKDALHSYYASHEEEIKSKYGASHIERVDDQIRLLRLDGSLIKIFYDYGHKEEHDKITHSLSFFNKYKY